MLFVHIMFIIKTLNDNGDSLVMNDGTWTYYLVFVYLAVEKQH